MRNPRNALETIRAIADHLLEVAEFGPAEQYSTTGAAIRATMQHGNQGLVHVLSGLPGVRVVDDRVYGLRLKQGEVTPLEPTCMLSKFITKHCASGGSIVFSDFDQRYAGFISGRKLAKRLREIPGLEVRPGGKNILKIYGIQWTHATRQGYI